jgi:hypothetical protein
VAEATISDPPAHGGGCVGHAVLTNAAGGRLQPVNATCFAGLSRTEWDQILQSFASRNRRPYAAFPAIIKGRTARTA